MKIKTQELAGKALDLAVQMAQGFTFQNGMPDTEWAADSACRTSLWRLNPSRDVWTCVRCQGVESPSTDWAEGGSIIEQYRICVAPMHGSGVGNLNDWIAQRRVDGQDVDALFCERGATALISAMRCYVASKLGDEVEIPAELL